MTLIKQTINFCNFPIPSLKKPHYIISPLAIIIAMLTATACSDPVKTPSNSKQIANPTNEDNPVLNAQSILKGDHKHATSSYRHKKAVDISLTQNADKLLSIVNHSATQYINNYLANQIYYDTNSTVDTNFGVEYEAAADITAEPTAASYSQTNLIEQNVDEADFVKQNSSHIFLYGNKNGNKAIRIYKKNDFASSQPTKTIKPVSILQVNNALNIEGLMLSDDHLYTLSIPDVKSNPESSVIKPKVAIRDYNIKNPDSTKLNTTYEIEGDYQQARKINNNLFVITNHNLVFNKPIQCPQQSLLGTFIGKIVDTAGSAVESCQAKYLLNNDSLLDRMPKDINGKPISPETCYLPNFKTNKRYDNNNYHSLTLIHNVDLQGGRNQTLCMLGTTDGFYMSNKSLYFAFKDFKPHDKNNNQPLDTSSTNSLSSLNKEQLDIAMIEPNAVPQETSMSLIHKFSINNNHIIYAGTGSVAGTINEDVPSFSMNEYNGVLRIATGLNQGFDVTNMLHTLRESDHYLALETLATLPNEKHPKPIGKPRERIKGIRFMGEQGYIVTFRNSDPLYKINLKNPLNPVLEGALEMPGYSAYLHKINDQYLMGVGYTVNEYAQPSGIQTTLFDISKSPKIVSQDTITIKDGNFQPSFKLLIDNDSKAISTVSNAKRFRVTIPYLLEHYESLNETNRVDKTDDYDIQTKALEYEIDPKSAKFLNIYRRDGQKLKTDRYDFPRFRALIDDKELYYTTDDGAIYKYEWGKP